MCASSLVKHSVLLFALLLRITCGPADCKSILQLNSWETQGPSDGYAIQTADGLIWCGSLNGCLRRYDPKIPHRIISENKLAFGIGPVTKLEAPTGMEVIVVGHGNGINCYAANGTALMVSENVGATFDYPPVQFKDSLLFIPTDSSAYRLSVNDLKLEQIAKDLPGTGTCPANLMLNPRPVIVYGTKYLGDVLTREYSYSVILRPVSRTEAEKAVLFEVHKCATAEEVYGSNGCPPKKDLGLSRLKLGKVEYRPTVVSRTGSDLAVMVTTEGKVLTADVEKVNYEPIFDLKSRALGPVIQLKGNNLCVLSFDSDNSSYTKTVFNLEGQLVSKSTIQEPSGTAVSSKPVSEPALFENRQGNVCVLQGFADRILRLINLENGRVEAVLRTKNVVTKRPAQLTSTDFFLTEEEGDLPLNMTNQYFVRVLDD